MTCLLTKGAQIATAEALHQPQESTLIPGTSLATGLKNTGGVIMTVNQSKDLSVHWREHETTLLIDEIAPLNDYMSEVAHLTHLGIGDHMNVPLSVGWNALLPQALVGSLSPTPSLLPAEASMVVPWTGEKGSMAVATAWLIAVGLLFRLLE